MNAHKTIRLIVVLVLVSATLMSSGCIGKAGEAFYRVEIGGKDLELGPAPFWGSSEKTPDKKTERFGYGDIGKRADELF